MDNNAADNNATDNNAADNNTPDYNAMSDGDFRSEVRTFFETECPHELRHLPHRSTWAEVKDWHQKLFDKGWVAPAWPKEYGGMGLDGAKMLIFFDEQQRLGVVRGRDMGVIMVGPLIIKYGSDEQTRTLAAAHPYLRRYLVPGLFGTGCRLRSRQLAHISDT